MATPKIEIREVEVPRGVLVVSDGTDEAQFRPGDPGYGSLLAIHKRGNFAPREE